MSAIGRSADDMAFDASVQDRAGADLEIIAVDVPNEVAPGAEVEVEVTVRDTSSSTAPGENFNQGWVVVTAGVDAFVIWKCFVIRPGETVTVDDCSSTIGNCNDGEFDMPDSDAEVTVRAGGFTEGTDCVQAASLGQRTDEVTRTVRAQQFDQDSVRVVQGSCGASPSTLRMPEQTTLNAIIRNDNPVTTTQRASFFLITSPCTPTPVLAESVEFTLEPGGAARVQLTKSPSNPLADQAGCVRPGEWPLFAQPVDVREATSAEASQAADGQTIKTSAREAVGMSADPRANPASASCGSLTIRDPFDPDKVSVPGCGNPDPNDPTPGQRVTIPYVVENQNPVAAEYTAAVILDGQRIETSGRQQIGRDTQDRNKEITFEAPDRPGESPSLRVEVLDVTEVTGLSLRRRMAQAANGESPEDRNTLLAALIGAGVGGAGLLARNQLR